VHVDSLPRHRPHFRTKRPVYSANLCNRVSGMEFVYMARLVHAAVLLSGIEP
jgi:hypothetical protein